MLKLTLCIICTHVCKVRFNKYKPSDVLLREKHGGITLMYLMTAKKFGAQIVDTLRVMDDALGSPPHSDLIGGKVFIYVLESRAVACVVAESISQVLCLLCTRFSRFVFRCHPTLGTPSIDVLYSHLVYETPFSLWYSVLTPI